MEAELQAQVTEKAEKRAEEMEVFDAKLKAEMEAFDAELEAGIEAYKAELQAELEAYKAELKAGSEARKAKYKADLDAQNPSTAKLLVQAAELVAEQRALRQRFLKYNNWLEQLCYASTLDAI
jgi:membrane protein involved in colicin uptake